MLEPVAQTEPTYPSSKAAEVAGVHQQTVIRWAKEGFLRPSKPHSATAHRRYTLNDLVAARIASTSIEFGIKRDRVREIVDMVQRADREEMKTALLFTARSETPGKMRHYWCADTRDTEKAGQIQWLRDEGRMISEGTLLELVEEVLKGIHEKLIKESMAGTELPEAN